MKKFFEEYGFVLIAVIVIVALIGLVKTVGADSIKDRTELWLQNLTNSGNNVMSTLDSGVPETPEEPETPEDKIAIEGTMAKGNIVTIDGKEYRILSMTDTEAKLLAMYDATQMAYDADKNEIASFNGIDGLQYAGSDLDNYLENTFYPSLSFKDAIIPQDIVQSMFTFELSGQVPTSGTYYHFWYKLNFTSTDTSGPEHYLIYLGSANIGERHVYALSIEDIVNYLGDDWSPQQLNTMFWNIDYSLASTYTWLRSSYNTEYNSHYVSGRYGGIRPDVCTEEASVRPAFVIDLTKCEYTK